MKNNEILDWEEALVKMGGHGEILQSVAQSFLENCPELLESIRKAAGTGDWQDLQRSAHTLRGSASIFGAKPTQEISQELELLAQDGRLSEIPGAISRLEAEIDRLNPAIQTHLENGQSG